MSFKKWIFGKADKQAARIISEECDIDPFSALIACSRGITDPSELEFMLSNEPLLADSRELTDIDRAANAVREALSNKEKIAVYADYDCDGVTATAVMCKCLKSLNADFITYIPDRIDEGYGMNNNAVDNLAEAGVKLIITVDNGISCAQVIDYASKKGIKTVVTDHHLPPEKLPNAVAVVDPHRSDCSCAFKEICGAEVAFKLVCVLLGREPEEILYDYADLLCIAVIGDVMPLVNENRCIVKAGIEKIRTNPSIGISSIISVAGIDRKTINAGRIAFGIVPRINAAGRMGSANDALMLLSTEDMRGSLTLANKIDALNAERQQIEQQVTEEAVGLIQKYGYQHNRVIIVCGEKWHLGTIGIVASRICERYGRPTVVISISGDSAHGSGRSIKGFHLFDALNSCKACLETFGGHELAAGVTLKTDKIDELRSRINEYALTLEPVVPELRLDFNINPAGMSVDMVEAIKLFEPFGIGNPQPVFGLIGVKLDKIIPVGAGKHLKLLFSKNGSAFQAILFGVGIDRFCFAVGDILDLAVSLDTSFYKDSYVLSIQIKGIRPTCTDDELLFKQLYAFDDFITYKSGFNSDELLPPREQVVDVYKYIAALSPNEEQVKYKFLNSIGIARTSVAIKALSELGLIKENDGRLTIVRGAKTDLSKSPIYSFLANGVK